MTITIPLTHEPVEARPSRTDRSFQPGQYETAQLRAGVFLREWKRRGRPKDFRMVFTTAEGQAPASNEARQRDVARGIFASERRAEEALLEGASSLAWRWARQYGQGLAQPDWGASEAERLGWRLHRLGYHQPPVRILQQRLARSMQ